MEQNGYFFLKPGGIYVSAEETQVHTVLGSCVSVCVFDTVLKVGGINHFIFHRAMSNPRSCRYGDVAVPHLLWLMMQSGSQPEHLIAQIIGGSKNVIPGSIVGEENAKIASEILAATGIKIGQVDVGGERFRKLIFSTGTGELHIKKGEVR